ncbi:DUF2968 domain-containing protein [Burkholderia sp. Ac-20379]|uniref:DUF2968 domain-containing protein n=2 Tax=Burkholderia sp. Ac-20379 TaxID=2703900 RepID=UPI001F121004|nr:DUF2968 domain-containing protein [Burkholderia sp. Ac-20379]
MSKRSKVAGIGRAMPWVALCVLAWTGPSIAAEPAADAVAQVQSKPPVAGTRPDVTTLTPDNGEGAAASSSPDAAAAVDAQGNVGEMMQMLRDHQLTEMRTTYNGSYGASMLFYPREMTYYVALFQDKHFWRVVKSQERPRAEMIYQNFADQTVQLADLELRRTELAAQKQFLERVIGLSEDHAKRLQADLDIARAQRTQIDERQRAVQNEANALAVEQRASQLQLRDLERQVRQLQQQNEHGLSPAAK